MTDYVKYEFVEQYIYQGLVDGVTVGSALGGAGTPLSGGSSMFVGGAIGGCIGVSVYGVFGACKGQTISVSRDIKVSLVCKKRCSDNKWIVDNVIDYSEVIGYKSRKNGDLYID